MFSYDWLNRIVSHRNRKRKRLERVAKILDKLMDVKRIRGQD